MRFVQLFYKDISQIESSGGFSVARLVDVTEKYALTVICDKPMSDQIVMRSQHVTGCEQMLPEVLYSMLADHATPPMECRVYDVVGGQYRVALICRRPMMVRHIRMSDAVLLHIIAQIPIFIEEKLMARQCSPYGSTTAGIAIPINTLDTEHLNRELQRAIEDEDYRLASHLHEELQRRTVT